MNKKGFKLIDAMIIVSILMLFAALLIPAIASAKKKAKAEQKAKTGYVMIEEFPSVKLLTTSAEEYCKSVGRELSDYNMIGVKSLHSNLYKSVPVGTEVIVDYRPSEYTYAGTALIPKER